MSDAAAKRLLADRRLWLMAAYGFVAGLPLPLSGFTFRLWLSEGAVSLAVIGLTAAAGCRCGAAGAVQPGRRPDPNGTCGADPDAVGANRRAVGPGQASARRCRRRALPVPRLCWPASWVRPLLEQPAARAVRDAATSRDAAN